MGVVFFFKGEQAADSRNMSNKQQWVKLWSYIYVLKQRVTTVRVTNLKQGAIFNLTSRISRYQRQHLRNRTWKINLNWIGNENCLMDLKLA